MALRKSTQALARVNSPHPLDASSAIPVYGEIAIKAGEFAANDVAEIIPWPAGTVPLMVKAHLDDLGSNETVLDIGVLTGQWLNSLDDAGAARVCGQEIAAASTLGQAGGSLDVAAAVLTTLTAKNYDRSIGVKVVTPPTTPTVGAKLRFMALFMPVFPGQVIGT